MDEEVEILEPFNKKSHIIPSLIAGYFAGIGHILVAHPADTLKVRLLIED